MRVARQRVALVEAAAGETARQPELGEGDLGYVLRALEEIQAERG